MKKQIFVVIVLLLTSTCHGQQYVNFPKSNTIWTEVYWPFDDLIHPWIPSFHCYGFLNKDTIINSKKYHKLYKSNDTIFDESEYCGGIREDSLKRVFYYGDSTYYNYPNKEILLFDFSVKVGDTLRNKKYDSLPYKYNLYVGQGWIVVKTIDSVFVSNKYRKRINFDNYGNSWVEGIGNISRGLLFTPGAVTTNGPFNEFVCLEQNDIWLYHDNKYPDCYPYYLSDIKEMQKKTNDIMVFPNPVKDISYIKLDDAINQFEVLEFFSITGQIVKSSRFNNKTTYTIDRNDFSKGIYFIKLTSKNGYALKGKFIIE